MTRESRFESFLKKTGILVEDAGLKAADIPSPVAQPAITVQVPEVNLNMTEEQHDLILNAYSVVEDKEHDIFLIEKLLQDLGAVPNREILLQGILRTMQISLPNLRQDGAERAAALDQTFQELGIAKDRRLQELEEIIVISMENIAKANAEKTQLSLSVAEGEAELIRESNRVLALLEYIR